jgi:hypothetical protein
MGKKINLFLLTIFFVLFLSTPVLAVCPIPDTGQTKCYYADGDEISPCPSPGQDFYGQDAQYICNPPSYTKLDGSGNPLPGTAPSWVMVRDDVTRLIWEVKTDDGSIHDKDTTYNWHDAQNVFIAALNTSHFGGYADWRVPTAKELMSIVNQDAFSPSINTNFFPNTVSSYYWSSTTHIYYQDEAWIVYFDNGELSSYHKTGSHDHLVRAVRGEESGSVDHFIDNGDGTVTNADTDLMWQKDSAPGYNYTWQQALAYCENLTLAGYNDWRLPNINELQSLVDYESDYPSINTTFFPDTKSSYYWSSTTHAHYLYDTLIVWFYYGHIVGTTKSYNYYVRAVREGECGSFTTTTIVASTTTTSPTSTTTVSPTTTTTVSEPRPVPDTGQSTCYDNDGEMSCPQPGEPFYGQDAQYTITPQSYTKLDEDGNELSDSVTEWVMVRDNVTGLIWEVKTDDGSVHDKDNTYHQYENDLVFLLNLNTFGGFSDWRLPTVKELSSLVNRDRCNPSVDVSYFPHTAESFYWASTMVAGIATYAWVIDFRKGLIMTDGTPANHHMQAVHGPYGSLGNYCIDNGDGTVTDMTTGLMWQQAGAEYKTWEEALLYCEELILAEHNDWHLPDVNELQSLVDYSRRDPSINISCFPDTVLDSYWTSTTDVGQPEQAWCVGFVVGTVYSDLITHKLHQCYVRAVRGPVVITTTTAISPTTTTIPSELCPVEELYGEYSNKTTQLRLFRDSVLRTTPEGQEIIRLYYELSPVIIEMMEGDEEFKKQMKEMVDGVLGLMGEME